MAELESGIQIRGDRKTRLGEDLPGKAAVLAPEIERIRRKKTDAYPLPRFANASADRCTWPVPRAKVEQRVDHSGEDAVGARRVIQDRAGRPVDRGIHCSRDRRVLEVGVFVAKLALDAKHAEIITKYGVDVIAELVFDHFGIVDRHVRIGEASREAGCALNARIDADIS